MKILGMENCWACQVFAYVICKFQRRVRKQYQMTEEENRVSQKCDRIEQHLKTKRTVMSNYLCCANILFSSEENLHFILVVLLVSHLDRHVPNFSFSMAEMEVEKTIYQEG